MGAVRHSCIIRLAQERTGHNNPTAVGTKTTQAEVTLISAVGDDFTTLAVPSDATPEENETWGFTSTETIKAY